MSLGVDISATDVNFLRLKKILLLISLGTVVPPFDSLVSQGLSNVFSLCMLRSGDHSPSRDDSGVVTLGGIDSSFYSGPIM